MKESTQKKLIRMKVSDLIPYSRNPRKIPKEAVDDVKESFRQCGVIDPIEIDENNVILSGHSRRLAAIDMGIEEVDVLQVVGLTESQKRKYRLLANKAGEKSGWDYDLLAEEIDSLDFEEYDFDWDLPEEKDPDAVEDDYEVTIPRKPKTKAGDIFQLGRHRLMCGDSTSVNDVQVLLGGVQLTCS